MVFIIELQIKATTGGSSSSRLYFSTGDPFSPYMGLICQGVLRAYRHMHTSKIRKSIQQYNQKHGGTCSYTKTKTT